MSKTAISENALFSREHSAIKVEPNIRTMRSVGRFYHGTRHCWTGGNATKMLHKSRKRAGWRGVGRFCSFFWQLAAILADKRAVLVKFGRVRVFVLCHGVGVALQRLLVRVYWPRGLFVLWRRRTKTRAKVKSYSKRKISAQKNVKRMNDSLSCVLPKAWVVVLLHSPSS